MTILLVILAVVIVLALISSMIESAADTAQAVAVAEVARVGQIAAEGQKQATGVIAFLVVLLVLVILAAVAFCVFIYVLNKRKLAEAQKPRIEVETSPRLPGPNALPQLDPGALVSLMTLKMISSMMEQERPRLPERSEPQPLLVSGEREGWW